MDIAGKVALISGGASGLGMATARMLLSAGCSVVVLDLPGAERDALVHGLGSKAVFAPGDVTDEAAAQAAVDAAFARFGGLQIVVNCAGIGGATRTVGRAGPMSFELFKRVVSVNLFGTFNVIRLAAARMIEQEPHDGERGVIINTASVAAYEGQIGQAAYSASKGGIVGMTLPIARDLASMLIRVCTIAPGAFDTPLLGRASDDRREALTRDVPHPHRLGRPEEYAQLVQQIVENQMLNGETIRLDGALRLPPR
jgi:NAD(P)-dependent dehydrogenase (short-subunit alcohol dehydrogenase family)